MSDKTQITQDGYNQLINEINQLMDIERPAVIKAVADARSLGDLSENAEYHAAREKQRMIESKLSELQKFHLSCEVVDFSVTANQTNVKFGASVSFLNLKTNEEKTITIVSEYESNPSKGLISINTPIAKIFLGKSVYDVCQFSFGGKLSDMEIIKIEYKK